MADVRREFVRGLGHVRIRQFGEELFIHWEALEATAAEWLDGERASITGRRYLHALDMRYRGQSFSITTFIPAEVRENRSLAGIAEAFHKAHEAIYGFREDDESVEAVTQRLSIIGEVPKRGLQQLPPGVPAPKPLSKRQIFYKGRWLDTAIFRREQFGEGSRAEGPAVVEQDDTCTWIPPGWALTTNKLGVLLVTKAPMEMRHVA